MDRSFAPQVPIPAHAAAARSVLARGLSIAALAFVTACSPPGRAPDPFAAPVARVVGALPNFRAITELAQSAVVDVLVSGPAHDDADALGKSVTEQGQGSGFIIAANGVVLTAAHVVEEAEVITVRLADRREFAARLVGLDRLTDVAVLRISTDGLRTAPLGSSARLQAGDWVLAIGSPFGLEHSATAGLVSAVNRALPDTPAFGYIQTDVALNPGNSGGPLFNTRGEVVGINAQIFSLSGGFQGISFAVPMDVARHAARQILAGGRALHGALGVKCQELDASLATALGLGSAQGALVVAVQDDGAAAHAGLREGDVVVRAAATPVVSYGDLSGTIAMHLPGEHVRLDVWREGRIQPFDVVLQDGSDPLPPFQVALHPENQDVPGLQLAPLRAQGGGAPGRGLLVESVSGRAERAGILPGDIVLAIGGKPTDSVDVAGAALGPHAVAVLVQRDGERRYVALAPAPVPAK